MKGYREHPGPVESGIALVEALRDEGRYFEAVLKCKELADIYQTDPQDLSKIAKAERQTLDALVRNVSFSDFNARRLYRCGERVFGHHFDRSTRRYGIQCLFKSMEMNPVASLSDGNHGLHEYGSLYPMIAVEMGFANSTVDLENLRVIREIHAAGLSIAHARELDRSSEYVEQFQILRKKHDALVADERQIRDMNLEPMKLLPLFPLLTGDDH